MTSTLSRLPLPSFAFLLVFLVGFSHAQAGTPGVSPSAGENPHLHSDSECEKKLYQHLQNVIDPELDVNIVDLGIVRRVHCDEANNINIVTIILTSPFCPYIKNIVADIKEESKKLFPHNDAKVVVDTKTRWSPSNMSPRAKAKIWGGKE